MNSIKNKVTLIGNVSKTPEVRTITENKKVARIYLASNEVYKNAKGEKITQTTWHNIVLWGKLAELAEKQLNKGVEIAIDGKLINRNYTDKNGVLRYTTEIQANGLIIMGKA
jgi:single-strand DNA-binding protein